MAKTNKILRVYLFIYEWSSAIAEGPRDAPSIKIVWAAAELYKKSHLKCYRISERP